MTRTWFGGLASMAFCLLACGGSQAHPSAPPHAVRPDFHGDPVALLPHDPLLWMRADLAALRTSSHWAVTRDLVRASAPEALATLSRELGFDALEHGDLVALGFYAPHGGHADGEANAVHAWPLLYVRGGFDRTAVIAAARARAPAGDPLLDHMEDGVSFLSTRARAYWFPEPDVMLVFDPALTRRLLRRVRGEESRSAEHDPRFEALWAQVDGRAGTIQIAADLARLRDVGAVQAVDDDLSRSLDTVVVRGEAPGDVRIRVAAMAHTILDAERVTEAIDHVRQRLLDRFDVRMLGMSRLLNQGVTAVNEGTLVRVRVDAQESEVRRLLRAAQMLR